MNMLNIKIGSEYMNKNSGHVYAVAHVNTKTREITVEWEKGAFIVAEDVFQDLYVPSEGVPVRGTE